MINIATMSSVKVLIVEDEPAIAKYIENSLKDVKYQVVDTAFDYDDAILGLDNHRPDVVFLDINLEGDKDGIDLANLINEKYGIPFLFITSYSNTRTIERVKLTQPIGYLLKPFTEEELRSTLEIALFRFENQNKAKLPQLEILNRKLPAPISSKEYDMLIGLYEGYSNKELAEEHFVSVNTIKTHLRNLYSKLDVKSRSDLLIKLRSLI